MAAVSCNLSGTVLRITYILTYFLQLFNQSNFLGLQRPLHLLLLSKDDPEILSD